MGNGKHVVFFIYHHAHHFLVLQCFAVDDFECHSATHAFHEVAALGIEVDDVVLGFASFSSQSFEVSQGVLHEFAVRQAVTIAEGVDGWVGVVALCLWLLEDREHAGENARKVTGAFAQFVFLEPRQIGLWNFIQCIATFLIDGSTCCPIGHVAGVGSHFVEACHKNN